MSEFYDGTTSGFLLRGSSSSNFVFGLLVRPVLNAPILYQISTLQWRKIHHKTVASGDQWEVLIPIPTPSTGLLTEAAVACLGFPRLA